MDLFAQIEKSIDDKIAVLQHLNQRLRYNKQILLKTIREKAEFHNLTNSVETSFIPPSNTNDVEAKNDLIESGTEEITLESKLDMILSLAKSTRVSVVTAKNDSQKGLEHKRSGHESKITSNKSKHNSISDAASVSSQLSTRKENSIPLSNPRNAIRQEQHRTNPSTNYAEKNIKEVLVTPIQAEFTSAIIEQLNFLSRNRIHNRFKAHFVTNQKLSQAQSLICEKVTNLNFLCPPTSTLFQIMSYLLSLPKLRQLVTKLRLMKNNNKFYMDEIITLVVLQARPIVQKLSKQALLAKTSLGLDDTMLLEHWLMGQLLLGIVSFVLNNNYQNSLGKNNLLWLEFQNSLMIKPAVGYMLKNEEISVKVRSRILVELLSKNMENIFKLTSRVKLHDVVLKLKLACKDIIRNRHATENNGWKEFLVCYRVIYSIVLVDAKKINCSILNQLTI